MCNELGLCLISREKKCRIWEDSFGLYESVWFLFIFLNKYRPYSEHTHKGEISDCRLCLCLPRRTDDCFPNSYWKVWCPCQPLENLTSSRATGKLCNSANPLKGKVKCHVLRRNCFIKRGVDIFSVSPCVPKYKEANAEPLLAALKFSSFPLGAGRRFWDPVSLTTWLDVIKWQWPPDRLAGAGMLFWLWWRSERRKGQLRRRLSL